MTQEAMKDILAVLEQNARATPEEISEMTGQTPEEVRTIIAEAERDKTIVKYKTLVNWESLGEEVVMAHVEVRVAPQRDVGFDSIAQRIARFPEVRSLYLMSGGLRPLRAAGGTLHERGRKLRRPETGGLGGGAWHVHPLPPQALQGGRGNPGRRGQGQAPSTGALGAYLELLSRR